MSLNELNAWLMSDGIREDLDNLVRTTVRSELDNLVSEIGSETSSIDWPRLHEPYFR